MKCIIKAAIRAAIRYLLSLPPDQLREALDESRGGMLADMVIGAGLLDRLKIEGGKEHGLDVDIRIRAKGDDVFLQASGITEVGMYMLLDMLVDKHRKGELLDVTDVVGDN